MSRQYERYTTEIVDTTKHPFEGRWTNDSTWATPQEAERRARELSRELPEMQLRALAHWRMPFPSNPGGYADAYDELACFKNGRRLPKNRKPIPVQRTRG